MTSTMQSSSGVWKEFARWFPSRNADCDYWWGLTGPHLAAMVESAQLPKEKQLEILTIHYHHVVPSLGSCPHANGTPKWKSMLHADGSPIEYSWKWNSASGKPDVRLTVEPNYAGSGTSSDPLNQVMTKKLLHQLDQLIPSHDLTWVYHFLTECYDHDMAKYAKELAAGVQLGTTTCLALEFVEPDLQVKTYLLPRKLGQTSLWPIDKWESTIRGLGQHNPGLDVLVNFLRNDAEGQQLNQLNLSVDNVEPSQSRMKFYFQTPRTCFDSVRQIMTLAGQKPDGDGSLTAQLAELRSLILALTGLPADYPDSSEVPTGGVVRKDNNSNYVGETPGQSGYLYYFDIRPGAEMLPEIKCYIPTSKYGGDDAALAKAICGWMEAKGRGAYCSGYREMLARISEHRRLEDGKGIQTYVSCMFKKNGQLDITTYISPECFHAGRSSSGATGSGRKRRSFDDEIF